MKQKKSIVKDYNSYHYSAKEIVLYCFVGMIFMFTIGYIFYRNIYLSGFLSLSGIYYLKIKKKNLIRKQKWELNIQFKDLLYFLTTSLSAGRSLENSFKAALSSLKGLYNEDNTFIISEIKIIIVKLEMNENIEDCLLNLAKRSAVEDIQNFADVLVMCKRKGGNINEVIKNTSSVIKDRIEIRQEIEIMLSSKKNEQLILSLTPLVLILILTYSAYDFMKPVFLTLTGKVAMTLALLLIACGYLWSKNIMDIKV